MSKVEKWLLRAAVLAFLLPAGAQASENATFECAAGPTQICHFSILRSPGGMQSFVVRGRQSVVISGLAPGHDLYLVAVDQPVPLSANACRHANFRCKIAIVGRGINL